MSKDDLSRLVRAGLRVGLVDRRPDVAATSSAMDGADDQRWGIAPAALYPQAKQRVHSRASAIRNNHIYEVKSAYILQPGPAALTEGSRQLHAILAHTVNQPIEDVLLPKEKTDAALGLPPPAKPVEHGAVS